MKKSKGYTVRKYKGDPFKPRPHLRIDPKSRRHFPVAERANFCIRKLRRDDNGKLVPRCKNGMRCAECAPLYRLWEDTA